MPTVLLVSTRKGLFLARRSPAGWRLGAPAFEGVNVSLALHDPRDGAIYAALEHGHFGPKLHRSDDGGRSWAECATPAYPEPGPDDVTTDPMGRPMPWTTKLLWSLAVDPRADGALWCGTLPGGLFHSHNRGKSWTLVRSLWDRPERARWFGGGKDVPGMHSVCVDPRDPQRLVVGLSCGGAWRSDDGGATWTVGQGMRAAYVPKAQARDPDIQDPHRIVQSPSRPDRLWCQHHNGIFVSDDGGLRWREVRAAAPSRFGFAVAVHPSDPDVAWFVPAVKDENRVPVGGRLVVTMTRDGGRTLRVMSRGLPRSSWDIVLRHALDVDHTGGALAFGSTTGGLWTSDDGGRSFRCASAHLPPIHAVSFAEPRPRRAPAARKRGRRAK